MPLPRRAAVALALLAAAPRPAPACTYFELRPPGLPAVIANTMEWYEPWSPKAWSWVVHPRGGALSPCMAPPGKARFGFVAAEAYGGLQSAEAFNERGLSATAHAYRGGGPYTAPTPERSVCALALTHWIAATFATAAEVAAALPATSVTGPVMTQWSVADADGGSIVIDYMDGALHVHNNTVGVLTNDPEFPWQLRNLNNYVALTGRWPSAAAASQASTEVGVVPRPVGHGQNLLGLPGDFSPPTRFVRAFWLRALAMHDSPPRTADDTLVLATALHNAVHIPRGVNARADLEPGWDFTQLATLRLPASRELLWREYLDMTWRRISLDKLDFTQRRVIPISDGGLGIVDVA